MRASPAPLELCALCPGIPVLGAAGSAAPQRIRQLGDRRGGLFGSLAPLDVVVVVLEPVLPEVGGQPRHARVAVGAVSAAVEEQALRARLAHLHLVAARHAVRAARARRRRRTLPSREARLQQVRRGALLQRVGGVVLELVRRVLDAVEPGELGREGLARLGVDAAVARRQPQPLHPVHEPLRVRQLRGGGVEPVRRLRHLLGAQRGRRRRALQLVQRRRKVGLVLGGLDRANRVGDPHVVGADVVRERLRHGLAAPEAPVGHAELAREVGAPPQQLAAPPLVLQRAGEHGDRQAAGQRRRRQHPLHQLPALHAASRRARGVHPAAPSALAQPHANRRQPC